MNHIKKIHASLWIEKMWNRYRMQQLEGKSNYIILCIYELMDTDDIFHIDKIQQGWLGIISLESSILALFLQGLIWWLQVFYISFAIRIFKMTRFWFERFSFYKQRGFLFIPTHKCDLLQGWMQFRYKGE